MALNKVQLSTSILTMLNDMALRTENPTEARQDFANNLADAIDTYVKSASVLVPGTGLAAPNGPVTGIANGTLS